MKNHFCKKPLHLCTEALVRTALGKEPADMVIRDAQLINVCTHEILPHTDVAVRCGRVALVGDAAHCIGRDTLVYEASGRYVAPAFMDGHIHVESSMLTATEYAKAVIPHGTAGIFMDPHEICNVLGLDGVRWMLQDAAGTPLKAMLTTPSCVPAVPGFEDTGAAIGPAEVAETMTWPECVGLGEMMNFPGILAPDARTHAIVGETLKADKIVTGHFSIPETGAPLSAYVAAGVRCCHESTREIDALTKMRLGMYAQMREGSAWHDLKEVAKAITKHEVDSRFACLISDDAHPNTLQSQGHLDHIVARAIEEGIDPVTAIQMVTLNTAACFDLDGEMGSVTPGKCADIVILSDLEKVKVDAVFIDGDLVAENGRMIVDPPAYDYPAAAKNTVHLDPVTEKDFRIPASGKEADVHVIEIIPAKTYTYDRIERLPVVGGVLAADGERDILKAVCFERHHRTGTKGFGFIKGFGIRHGALAQTVAHDAHNLFVVGSDDADMALAANTLIACGGGAVAVRDGKVLGLVKLPIAGLMSDKPLPDTVEQVRGLEKAWRDLGCVHPSPFMTMAIVPLACLPETRLTNRGLVDCRTFRFMDLIEKIY